MKREFTYKANFADNFHGVVLGLWGTRASTVRSGLTCLMFGIFAAAVLRIMGSPPGELLPMAIALAISWGAFITLGLGGRQALLLTRRQRAIGPSRIVVSEEGLERSTHSASVRQDWAGITSIRETSRAFFMYDGTQPVFAIEKSAVGQGPDLEALRRFLRGKVAVRSPVKPPRGAST